MKTQRDLSSLRHLGDGLLGVRRAHNLRTGSAYPFVAGGAQGVSDTRDLLRTLDAVTFEILWDDLVNSLAMYNRASSEFLATMCYMTQEIGLREVTPGSMTFERGTEYGRPDRQRQGAYRARGFPVYKFQIATGWTRDFLLNARSEEIDAQHTAVLVADNQNLMNEILTSMFKNTPTTFLDDRAGSITVLPFYYGTGDTEVPPPFEGKTFAVAHNHFHTSGATTVTDANIKTMLNDLREHGHYGNLTLYISPDQEGDIRALVDVNGDPTFFPNWAYNFAGVAGYQPSVTQTVVEVGPEYIGFTNGFKVRMLNWIPTGYMVGYNSYGPNSRLNPLGFRERDNPLQQGLQIINPDGNDTYPIINSFYERWFGVGALNRGNASVMQVTASGTYAVPSGLTLAS